MTRRGQTVGSSPRGRCGLVLGLALTLGSLGLVRGQDLTSALRDYEARLQRPSLWKRTMGRVVLAATGEEAARDRLIQDFAKLEKPKEFIEASLIEIIVDGFDAERDLRALAAWRSGYRDPAHAWLWFRTLHAEGYYDDRSSLFGCAADAKLPVELRAAALHAIASSSRSMKFDKPALETAQAVLDSLPRRDRDRALLLEGAAAVVDAQRNSLRDPRYRPMVEALGRQLDDRGTDDRSRIVISRHLARIVGQGNLGLASGPWLAALDATGSDGPARGSVPVARFFGVEAVGSKVVFVIDASDSMLEPLTEREKQKLIPITGRSSKASPDDPTRDRIEAELPWDKIQNRYQAAVGFLELALRGLGKKQQFAVVLFGDTAELLPGMKGLQPASVRNVDRAVQVLWGLKPGPKSQDRPHGTLRGRTNLHGGLALAYRITGKGLGKRSDAADKRALMSGADTVFVLSDGDPTWDDYAASDSADGNDRAGDPETGAVADSAPGRLIFAGPFARSRFLLAEVARFNLLRRAQIHAIGFGDASASLLHDIAEAGLGESVMVGN